MSKKPVSSSDERTFTFVFPQSIIIAVKFSLWWPYARSIFSIFCPCMVSNVWKKSMNNSVASWLFAMYYVRDSKDSQNMWCCGLICVETVLFFLWIFLILGLIQLRCRAIIYVSSNCSKSYTPVVLSYSKVTFLGEWEDATFCLFFYCILLIDSMPSAAASMWIGTKFSCLSFRVCASAISSRESNFFLAVTIYLLISLLVSEDQS